MQGWSLTDPKIRIILINRKGVWCALLKAAGVKIQIGNGHMEAYALLRTLWREETDRPFPQIAYTERGKPYFPEEKLHFSITHTKNYAFCVLSDRPVGIDAEELSRKINPALAKKILSPGELRQYETAEDKNKALLTFWVLKEAEAKCTGEGIRIHPRHTDFSLNDPRVRETMGCLMAVIEG